MGTRSSRPTATPEAGRTYPAQTRPGGAGRVVAASTGPAFHVEPLRSLPGVPAALVLRVDAECLSFCDVDTGTVLRSFSYHCIICWGYTRHTFQFKVLSSRLLADEIDGAAAAAETPSSSRWRDGTGVPADGTLQPGAMPADASATLPVDATGGALDRLGAYKGARSVAVEAAFLHVDSPSRPAGGSSAGSSRHSATGSIDGCSSSASGAEASSVPFGVIPTLLPEGATIGSPHGSRAELPSRAGAAEGGADAPAAAAAPEGTTSSSAGGAAAAGGGGAGASDEVDGDGSLGGQVETLIMLTPCGADIEAVVMGAVRALMAQMDSRGVPDGEFATLLATLNSLADDGGELGDAAALDAVRQMALTRAFDARQAAQLVSAIGRISPFEQVEAAVLLYNSLLHKESFGLVLSCFPDPADRDNVAHRLGLSVDDAGRVVTAAGKR